MQQERLVYIIGDKFKDFANLTSLITISEFKDLLSLPSTMIPKNTSYLIAQGVSISDLNQVLDLMELRGLKKLLPIVNAEQIIKSKESSNLVHKHKPENIMITKPNMIGGDTFTSFLCIDENCAEMSDHVTGKHIQGMVLIEAARQMMLSVTETYFLSENEKNNSYFVLNYVNTTLNQFTFPLDIGLHYYVNQSERSSKGILKSTVTISIIQNEKKAGSVEISFSVYDKGFISEKESQMASKVLFDQVQTDSSMLMQKKIKPKSSVQNQTFEQQVCF